jgi:hypothetical protein
LAPPTQCCRTVLWRTSSLWWMAGPLIQASTSVAPPMLFLKGCRSTFAMLIFYWSARTPPSWALAPLYSIRFSILEVLFIPSAGKSGTGWRLTLLTASSGSYAASPPHHGRPQARWLRFVCGPACHHSRAYTFILLSGRPIRNQRSLALFSLSFKESRLGETCGRLGCL